MTDTNPGPGPDTTGQRASVEPSETAKRLRELELAFQFARGATFVVMALLTGGLGALGTGAINTRDLSNANAARLVVVEKAQADMAAQAREVATEAGATLGTSGSTIWTAGPSQRWILVEQVGPSERFNGRESDVRVEQTAKASSWWREAYARGLGLYEGQ